MDIDEVSARLEITDVLLRLGRGIDRNDVTLVTAAFHPEATLSLGYYVGDLGGYLARFRAMAEAPVQPLSGVQHRVGNMSVEAVGDTARVESYYDVCWRRQLPDGGAVDELAAARALDKLERRGGVWAITSRTLVWDWAASFPAGPTPWTGSDAHVVGARDMNDPAVAFWRDALA